jgi:hypothetical protein
MAGTGRVAGRFAPAWPEDALRAILVMIWLIVLIPATAQELLGPCISRSSDIGVAVIWAAMFLGLLALSCYAAPGRYFRPRLALPDQPPVLTRLWRSS